MTFKSALSELRGVLVVSREEGAQLGIVSRVYLDPKSRRIAYICFRSGWRGRESCVSAEAIESIGRDVLFVSSESLVTPIAEVQLDSYRSMRELRGEWVTTLGGDHLGTLDDLDVRESDWSICELHFADGKTLTVEADELTLGRDEILVPPDCADRVSELPGQRRGFLSRAFGAETAGQAGQSFWRSLRRRAHARDRGAGRESDLPDWAHEDESESESREAERHDSEEQPRA